MKKLSFEKELAPLAAGVGELRSRRDNLAAMPGKLLADVARRDALLGNVNLDNADELTELSHAQLRCAVRPLQIQIAESALTEFEAGLLRLAHAVIGETLAPAARKAERAARDQIEAVLRPLLSDEIALDRAVSESALVRTAGGLSYAFTIQLAPDNVERYVGQLIAKAGELETFAASLSAK
jgi:hypothetical protein